MIIKKYLQQWIDYLIGAFEVLKLPRTPEYRYLITDILLKQQENLLSVRIKYKIIGSRAAMEDSVKNLNSSDTFMYFRPDHAQIIVTLATLDAVQGYEKTDLYNRFIEYVDFVQKKVGSKTK